MLRLASTLLATALFASGQIGSDTGSAGTWATAVPASLSQAVGRSPKLVARFQGELVELHGGVAYTSTGRGVRAYDAHCRGWCSPLWTAPGVGGLLAVGRGTVFVGRLNRIDAYAPRCRVDGGLCTPNVRLWKLDPVVREPRWPTESRIDAPVVGAEEIYVPVREVTASTNHPADGVGRVFAFPRTCRERCAPAWRSPLYVGTLDAQPHGQRVYVASNEGLSVFRKKCETGGRVCKPIWTAPIDADNVSNIVIRPEIGDGLVLVYVGHDVGGGDGRPTGVYVFRARCESKTCPARRFIPTPLFGPPPEIINHRFFVVWPQGLDDLVTGFSTGCGRAGGACRAVWEARVREGGAAHVLIAGSLVYVRGFRGGGVTAFDRRCPVALDTPGPWVGNGCEPLWTYRPPRGVDSGPLLGPGGTLLITSHASMFAIPRGCTDPCTPVWRWEAPARMDVVDVAGRRIFMTRDTYVTDEPRTIYLRAPGRRATVAAGVA